MILPFWSRVPSCARVVRSRRMIRAEPYGCQTLLEFFSKHHVQYMMYFAGLDLNHNTEVPETISWKVFAISIRRTNCAYKFCDTMLAYCTLVQVPFWYLALALLMYSILSSRLPGSRYLGTTGELRLLPTVAVVHHHRRRRKIASEQMQKGTFWK